MSKNFSNIGIKLAVGIASAVVSVVASTMTERALNKALSNNEPETIDENTQDVYRNDIEEPETEETEEN